MTKRQENIILKTIAEFEGLPVNLIHDEYVLTLDSIDTVDLIFQLEKDFNCNIPDNEIENIKTVEDVISLFHLYV